MSDWWNIRLVKHLNQLQKTRKTPFSKLNPSSYSCLQVLQALQILAPLSKGIRRFKLKKTLVMQVLELSKVNPLERQRQTKYSPYTTLGNSQILNIAILMERIVISYISRLNTKVRLSARFSINHSLNQAIVWPLQQKPHQSRLAL